MFSSMNVESIGNIGGVKFMSDIIAVIEKLEGLKHLPVLTEREISDAESELGVKFAAEFVEYTLRFGAISAHGIELTGVVSSPRLNVVKVTLSERALNPEIPDDMYVIENTGVDGVIMLQDSDGKIYESAPNSKPVKKFSSLSEYLREYLRE